MALVLMDFNYHSYLQKMEKEIAMVKIKSGLSINYLDGNIIDTNEEVKEINFSITNASMTNLYYYIKLNNVTKTENITYELLDLNNNEEITDSFAKTEIKTQIKIEPGNTQRYHLKINNPKKQNIYAELQIDTIAIDHSIKNILLQNNKAEIHPEMTYDLPEKENKGLIEYQSEEGSTYYFRGQNENNYISFAGHLWRIVKINPDQTVTIVLDNLLEEEMPIYQNNEYESSSFLESDLYNFLNSWYEKNLKEYDEFIASAKYCTDDGAMSEEEGTIYYLPEQRIFKEYSPALTCPGTVITSKIALLTADDVMISGASKEENKDFYLNHAQRQWWTMTLNKKQNNQFYYITVGSDGTLYKDNVETNSYAIRPAITLIKKINVQGKGTIDDPYTLTLR